MVYPVDNMVDFHFDLCVIGGGINGAGIARDAAGRGLSVLLVEAQDLAGGTSSASTKLVHGGLRYLEHFEFKMVHEALKERTILLRMAPHLVRRQDFVLPHEAHQRPLWMIRAGLFLYDHLGAGARKRILPRSRYVDLREGALGEPLRSAYTDGFVYSDGWVDDSRLVVLNAVDAAARGARVMTYTDCYRLEVQGGRWIVSLCDTKSGRTSRASVSMVVNATGPWVGQFLARMGLDEGDHDIPHLRLVKGSHIILPRQYAGEQAYILQQPDGRVVFAIPYEREYTLVGTTEEDYEGDPREAMASDAEVTYLCEAYNRAFEASILPSDVLFTYSGVRPLFDDGHKTASAVTRDYRIYHHSRFAPPLLSVFGGKLTTYRVVSEKVVDRLIALSARNRPRWTVREPLAGGDMPGRDFDVFVAAQMERYPWLPEVLLRRYARAYCTRMDYFLYQCARIRDLGVHYGDGVYDVEVAYLRHYEWAKSAEDVLWRRSKLGLHVSEKTVAALEKAFL